MNPLVSPQWVAERLSSGTLTLVDATLPPVGVTPVVDTRARYLEAHLPGALFFDIEALSDHETSLPHMLPGAERFRQEMSSLGISDDATIVVYEQGNVFSAPRAWWMLRTLGAGDVRILDGGFAGWIAAGLPTEAGPVVRPAADFHAVRNDAAIRNFTDVQQLIETHGQIVDARSAGRFSGTASEPRPGLPSGHMPGATSVPYTELIDGDHMRSAEEIGATFKTRGLDLAKQITTTCGSGVTAAVLTLGLELCGATRVSLYDGSWAEYAGHPDAGVERNP